MAEYIEREALIDALMMYTWRDEDDREIDDSDQKRKFIEEWFPNIPTADVVPVVRGKWLTGNDNPRTYGRIRAMCGRCGAFALAEMVNAGSYKEQLSNFCPNCGADMMEES